MSDSWSDEFITDYIDDRLKKSDRENVENHLNDNPGDAEVAREFRRMGEGLRNAKKFSLDEGFAGRVTEQIQARQTMAADETGKPANPQFTTDRPAIWRSAAGMIATLAATLLLALFVVPRHETDDGIARLDEMPRTEKGLQEDQPEDGNAAMVMLPGVVSPKADAGNTAEKTVESESMEESDVMSDAPPAVMEKAFDGKMDSSGGEGASAGRRPAPNRPAPDVRSRKESNRAFSGSANVTMKDGQLELQSDNDTAGADDHRGLAEQAPSREGQPGPLGATQNFEYSDYEIVLVSVTPGPDSLSALRELLPQKSIQEGPSPEQAMRQRSSEDPGLKMKMDNSVDDLKGNTDGSSSRQGVDRKKMGRRSGRANSKGETEYKEGKRSVSMFAVEATELEMEQLLEGIGGEVDTLVDRDDPVWGNDQLLGTGGGGLGGGGLGGGGVGSKGDGPVITELTDRTVENLGRGRYQADKSRRADGASRGGGGSDGDLDRDGNQEKQQAGGGRDQESRSDDSEPKDSMQRQKSQRNAEVTQPRRRYLLVVQVLPAPDSIPLAAPPADQNEQDKK